MADRSSPEEPDKKGDYNKNANLSTGPGLGVEMDKEKLSRYPLQEK